jgi:DegV family protein with EDD domain
MREPAHIAIVTDSTCDIPQELTEQLMITVVPNLIIWDSQTYVDGKSEGYTSMSRTDFYTRLRASKTSPTTATASIGAYETAYRRCLDSGAEAVISFHAASKLSGIYNAASAAAQSFPGQVHVIDSGMLSLGFGFMVIAAAQAVRHRKKLGEVLAIANDILRRTRVMAVFESLEYIRRSGRVSWAKAAIGQLLGVHPIIELRDGKVMRIGDTRTRRKSLERMAHLFLGVGRLEQVAFLHTNAEDEARALYQMVNDSSPEPLGFVNVTTVIGTHVGPNAFGFACVKAST